jgi:hypothetical protein
MLFCDAFFTVTEADTLVFAFEPSSLLGSVALYRVLHEVLEIFDTLKGQVVTHASQ